MWDWFANLFSGAGAGNADGLASMSTEGGGALLGDMGNSGYGFAPLQNGGSGSGEGLLGGVNADTALMAASVGLKALQGFQQPRMPNAPAASLGAKPQVQIQNPYAGNRGNFRGLLAQFLRR